MLIDFLRKHQLMVVGILLFIVVLVVFGLFWAARNASNNKPAVDFNSGQYYDSGSQETVSDPEGKAPETYGATPGEPLYLGFSKLMDYGFTQYQYANVKKAFQAYATTEGRQVKEVSLTIASIRKIAHDREDPNPRDSVLFDVTADRTTALKAKIEYYDLDVVQVWLYDAKTNAQVFDSGVIKTDDQDRSIYD